MRTILAISVLLTISAIEESWAITDVQMFNEQTYGSCKVYSTFKFERDTHDLMCTGGLIDREYVSVYCVKYEKGHPDLRMHFSALSIPPFSPSRDKIGHRGIGEVAYRFDTGKRVRSDSWQIYRVFTEGMTASMAHLWNSPTTVMEFLNQMATAKRLSYKIAFVTQTTIPIPAQIPEAIADFKDRCEEYISFDD